MPLNSPRSGIMIVALLCGVDCNTITGLTGSTFEGQADSKCDGTKNCGDVDIVDLVQVQTTLLHKAISHKPGSWQSAAIVRALSLFQQHVVDAGLGMQVGMPDLSGLHQSLAQLVSGSIERNETPSDLENQTLDAIEQQMNTLIEVMPTRRDDAQFSLDEKREAIVACVDKIHRHHFATNHSNAMEWKKKHADCRYGEMNKLNARDEKYASLSELVGSPEAPGCMTRFNPPVWKVAHITSLLTCVDDIAKWASEYGSSLTQAKHDADVAYAEWNNTRPTCNHAQGEYEEQFCLYRQWLIDSCDDYERCYVDAVAQEAAELLKANATEGQIKTEWRALHRIVCLVRVLQADMTDQQGQLDDCLVATYPTEHLTITYNETVPAKARCDTSNVTTHPCVDLWLEKEYETQPWYTGGATTVTCVPCPEECDWQCYLDRYEDLRTALGAINVEGAEEHYMKTGKGEGRDCTCFDESLVAGCNWQCYLDRYPDLQTALANNTERAEQHYKTSGMEEGRDCTCQ